jgi:hypothetical protein
MCFLFLLLFCDHPAGRTFCNQKMDGHQRDTTQTRDPTTFLLPRITRLIKHNDALRPQRNNTDSLPRLVIQRKQFRQHKHCPSTTVSIPSPLLPNFPKIASPKTTEAGVRWSLIVAEGERPYYLPLTPADLSP